MVQQETLSICTNKVLYLRYQIFNSSIGYGDGGCPLSLGPSSSFATMPRSKLMLLSQGQSQAERSLLPKYIDNSPTQFLTNSM